MKIRPEMIEKIRTDREKEDRKVPVPLQPECPTTHREYPANPLEKEEISAVVHIIDLV